MIPGEEVTVNLDGGRKPVHINAIGISRLIEPIDVTGIVPTMQANVNSILDAGGLASINHPNYKWSFDHRQIAQISGATLLEVFNGHPAVNVYGAPGRPSYEEIWDGVLSAGRPIFGVATDDSHHYKEFGPDRSNPGRGWLMVRSERLSQEAIVDSIASGDFYSSTGVVLSELAVSRQAISLRIEPYYDSVYTTRFIGREGRVYAEVTGSEADYSVRGDEGYVRASVSSSTGTRAWTQPIILG